MRSATIFASVVLGVCMPVMAAEPAATRAEVSFGKGVPGLPPKDGLDFKTKPTAKADGDNVRIEFEVNKATDVAVEVLNEKGVAVRHVAAGLLGPFAPEPLTKDSLKQSLVWNRKDDDGKPVAGPCKVRVGLGLGVKRLNDSAGADCRSIVELPEVPWEAQNVPWLRAMTVGPDGTVYLVGGYYRNGKDGFPHIIAVDRDGNYVREVYPPPARLVPDKTPGLPVLKLADEQHVPMVDGWWNLFIGEMVNIKTMTSTAGHLLLSDGNSVLKFGMDGSIPKDVRLLKLPVSGRGRGFSIAASADGKDLLVSGCDVRSGGKTAPAHAVYRVALDGSGKSQVVFGAESEAGNDDKHLNSPAGLVVDAAGNVYIADYGNNRVVVVKPDGGVLRSIAADSPFDVKLDAASGAIYVLSAKRITTGSDDYALPSAVTKFGADGRTMGSASISLTLPNVDGRVPMRYAGMVVVPGSKSVLWVGGCSFPDGNQGHITGYTSGIVRIADDGDALKVAAADTLREATTAALRKRGRSFFEANHAPGATAPGSVWFIGATTVQRDGYRYGVAEFRPKSGYYYELRRHDRDGKPAPFPAPLEGKWPRFVIGQAAGDGDWPSLPARMDGRFFARTLVDFQGNILVEYYNFTLRGAPAASKLDPMCIDRFFPDGRVKQRDLVYGLEKGHTLSPFRVDRKGHIYLAAHVMPLGRTGPAEVEAALKAPGSDLKSTYTQTYGSVLKMSLSGGGFKWDGPVAEQPPPAGDLIRKPASAWAPQTSSTGRRTPCEGIDWLFAGIAPIANHQGLCICTHAVFDIDDHARVYVPDAYRMCINILDTEGNILLRFGRYGNQDDGKASLAFARPRNLEIEGQDVIRVVDPEQARATWIGLLYAAEETVAVP